DEKKVSGLLDSPATEKIYNLFQYLNRGTSAIGGSLLLVGRGDFDNQYTQVGGITTLISVYIEFFSSIAKEKLFNVEERKKELDDLKKDTENLCSSY
ncbi:14954_t:CDS:1, partial [Funneliformis geosporum]